jgi:CoA-transferase family III/MaoC like domain
MPSDGDAAVPGRWRSDIGTDAGRWLQLVFLQSDRYWADFTRRIGRPDLSEDPRFTPAANLIANSEAATAELAKTFGEHDHAYWAEILEDEEGVWSLVASSLEVLSDRQALANGYFVSNTDEADVEYKLVSNPVRFDETQPPPSRSPEHGEHTEEILLEFGYDWGQIAAIIEQPTVPWQALLYRLSGDRNPLHSDPGFAAVGGFARPGLHGLCTYGIAGRALLHGVGSCDPSRLRAMSARSSAPVQVVFEQRDGIALPQFRVTAGDGASGGTRTCRCTAWRTWASSAGARRWPSSAAAPPGPAVRSP